MVPAPVLSTRSNHDHDWIPVDQRLDVAPRLLQRLSRHFGIVARAEASGCARANQQPVFIRNVGQGEFVRVEKRVVIASLRRLAYFDDLFRQRGDVSIEQRFHGTKDVSSTAAGAQKENVHFPPACLDQPLN